MGAHASAPSSLSTRAGTHVVAVIGGATAGAEVAGRLAERGVQVVVFEQNAKPYGKIEDGLPRWHTGLRKKEYETIAAKLDRPEVWYVPHTQVGRDIELPDLARDWGFSAVVLACGAWRDRPVPIEGADAYLGKGLIYQNPFIIWFNHQGDGDYQGPSFETTDNALVLGGGLASIDVAKVLMLETTRAELRKRDISVPLVTLELKGIPKTLAKHDLRFEDLGLAGCTLFYRRRAMDMPVVEAPQGASPERLAKVRAARERVLSKAMDKYCFRFEPLSAPDALLVEDGRVAGLRLRRTRIENGRVVPTDETYERRGACVISSIGSIPEPIAGIPMKGELFDFSDWDLGRLDGYPRLFSVGNVVTGKGNIVASRKHATHVSEEAVERFLGLSEEGHDGVEMSAATTAAARTADQVHESLGRAELPSAETVAALQARIATLQKQAGYGGDLRAWLDEHTHPEPE